MVVLNKKSQWVLGVYMAVLLLSAVAVYLIPVENFHDEDILKPEERAKAELASRNLYEAAKEGEIEQVKNVSTNGQWSFDYTQNQLKISHTDHSMPVIAERKEIDDNKIELVSYLTPTILDGIDFTSKLKPPKIMLVGEELTIKPAEPYKTEFARFKEDFTVAQFMSGDSSIDIARRDYEIHVTGSRLLYLRIPKSLQIDTQESSLQIIMEEEMLN